MFIDCFIFSSPTPRYYCSSTWRSFTAIRGTFEPLLLRLALAEGTRFQEVSFQMDSVTAASGYCFSSVAVFESFALVGYCWPMKAISTGIDLASAFQIAPCTLACYFSTGAILLLVRLMGLLGGNTSLLFQLVFCCISNIFSVALTQRLWISLLAVLDAGDFAYYRLAGSLRVATGVSVGRMLDRWIKDSFLADQERSMFDYILVGFVGVWGCFGLWISLALLSLRPTDTKFCLPEGSCDLRGELFSSTFGGEAFLGEWMKCSFWSACGNGPSFFFSLLTEPSLDEISLFSLLPALDLNLPSCPRFLDNFFLELNRLPSLPVSERSLWESRQETYPFLGVRLLLLILLLSSTLDLL